MGRIIYTALTALGIGMLLIASLAFTLVAYSCNLEGADGLYLAATFAAIASFVGAMLCCILLDNIKGSSRSSERAKARKRSKTKTA